MMNELKYNTNFTGFDIATVDQALAMLESSTLDDDTKFEILGFISGIMQCVMNIGNTDNFEHTIQARLTNSPDHWHNGYNEIIKIFQKHHSCIPSENFEKIYGKPFDPLKFGGRELK